MRLGTWNLKWVVAFLVATAVGAAGVIVVLSVMKGGSEPATAQPTAGETATPAATPSGTLTPGQAQPTQTPESVRPAAPYYPLHIPAAPALSSLAPKRACPDGWQRISDDVLNYSICIPSDWGILDESTGQRSTQLLVHEEDLKILSSEGFPNPIGQPLDKPLQDPTKDMIYMAVDPVPPDSGIACDAQPRAPLGSLPAVQCEFRFNYTSYGDADYRADGNMVETDTVVALPNPQPGPVGSQTGYGLFIAVVGSDRAVQVHGDTISQILNSIEGQP